MKKTLILIAVFGLLAVGPLAGASFAYTASAGAFVAYTANNVGTEYFSNTSADGPNANDPVLNTQNVGFYIKGNGQVNSPILGANAKYLNITVNDAVSFTNGLSDAFKMLALAGDASVTSFGYYAYDGSTAPTFADLVPVFTTVDGVGTIKSGITLPHNFGLYLNDNGTYYYSTLLGYNAADTSNQHFAIFRGTSDKWYIGMEDRPIGSGDKDYNDMVVGLTPVPVPGALLLLGAGLVRLAAYSRKRRSLTT